MADMEEMNRIRAEMGAAPLPSGPHFQGEGSDEKGDDEGNDDTSTYEKRVALEDKNWQKLEAERLAKIQREEQKLAAQKEAERKARHATLEGKGLGQLGEGEKDLSTREWLKQSKKRQKKIEKARKAAEEFAERDKEAMPEYSSKDLAGVKVGHDVNEFDDLTGEQILTLKDAEIGSDSGEDELEHQGLVAQKQVDKKNKMKQKSATYDAADAHEGNKGILSHYDEGDKDQKAFTIDNKGSAANDRARYTGDDEDEGMVTINMDDLADIVGKPKGSDYQEARPAKADKPAKFKKSKKDKKDKKSKVMRKRGGDDDEALGTSAADTTPAPATQMDVDGQSGAASKKRSYDDFEFDDDLQTRLAAQRREALKKRKRDDADFARQLRNQAQEEEPELEEGGLLIDETAEFLSKVTQREERQMTQREKDRQTLRNREAGIFEDDGPEGDDPDEQKYEHFDEEAFNAHKRELAAQGNTEAKPITTTGLPEEHTMYNGVGATLNELRGRGALGSTDHSAEGLAAHDRARTKFLAEKDRLLEEFEKKNVAERERDRENGVFANMNTAEREAYSRKQNEKREQWLAAQQAEMFNAEYKPNVELKYNDEYGRAMNAKEAFKHLSHKFHGKGSGKTKTEKHLKRIEDERKAMAKTALIAGKDGGYQDNAADIARKEMNRAGVRLQ
ncbi:hypothetical protein MBLNU230_g8420t1 [Neophaeotheca triangularis]